MVNACTFQKPLGTARRLQIADAWREVRATESPVDSVSVAHQSRRLPTNICDVLTFPALPEISLRLPTVSLNTWLVKLKGNHCRAHALVQTPSHAVGRAAGALCLAGRRLN